MFRELINGKRKGKEKMKELRDHIIAELELKLGEGYRITPCNKTQNNGLILHGICIRKVNESMGYVLYTEGYVRNRSTGKPDPGEIANAMLQECRKHTIPRNVVGNVLDLHAMKDRIRMKLVNYDANKKELENVPHRRFLDLAVTYYLEMDPIEEQYASAAVTNKLMKIWNITEDELYRIGMDRLLTKDGCNVTDMLSILCQMAQAEKDMETEPAFAGLEQGSLGLEMFVASNHERRFGAASLLNTSLLQDIAERLGHSLVIYPSSIHELVIIPQKHGNEGYLGTEDVKTINANEVAREERLSNSIYRYDRESREVSIFQEGAPLFC